MHSANASNGRDRLGLLGIDDIHGVLGSRVQILVNLPVDQGWVLLWKADRRIDGVGLVVETCYFFGRKISRQICAVTVFETCSMLTDEALKSKVSSSLVVIKV